MFVQVPLLPILYCKLVPLGILAALIFSAFVFEHVAAASVIESFILSISNISATVTSVVDAPALFVVVILIIYVSSASCKLSITHVFPDIVAFVYSFASSFSIFACSTFLFLIHYLLQ